MKYSITLFVLALTVVSNCQEKSMFLTPGNGDSDVAAPEPFDASVLVGTVQDIIKEFQEPIGQKIDSVLSWVGVGGDTLKDMVKLIQEPLLEKLDSVLAWVGSEDAENVAGAIMFLGGDKLTTDGVSADDNNEVVIFLNVEEILSALGGQNTSSPGIMQDQDEEIYIKFIESFNGQEGVELGSAPVLLSF